MELSDTLLQAAAAVAAFFQSATGIGFGMIAGPFVLMVLDDPAAVVVSTLMSWMIAAVLFPFTWRGVDWRLARRLTVGAMLGLPAGFVLLALADIQMLKLGAGLTVAFLTVLMLFGAQGTGRQGLAGDLIFGGLGGLFGGALAMPGPTAAIRASGLGHGKTVVRASMIGFFMSIWPIILAGQWIALDFGAATLWNALKLAPATLAGLAAGHWAAAHVSETLFRRVVILLLIATSASLLGSVIVDWSGARAP